MTFLRRAAPAWSGVGLSDLAVATSMAVGSYFADVYARRNANGIVVDGACRVTASFLFGVSSPAAPISSLLSWALLSSSRLSTLLSGA